MPLSGRSIPERSAFESGTDKTVMIRPTFVVVALGVLVSGLGWLTVGTASAETKAERERAAAELVAEALFGEIYGKDSQRGGSSQSRLGKLWPAVASRKGLDKFEDFRET